MKHINCTTTFKSFVYKTLILLEFTYSLDKLFYLVLVFLNEIQVLKCCLLVLESSYNQQGKFISFLIYFFRPTFYFANFLEIYYIWIIFTLIQVYYILWIHLLTIGSQSNENFIQVIKKYQLKSTSKYLLVTIWKIFYVIQQEFLGFLIIEGNLVIILQDDNKFYQVIAFIILFQVLISMIVSDLFLNQSLQYIPKQLNLQIQTSPLTLIQKLLKFSIITIFVSSNQYKQLLVFFISLSYCIMEIYIQLNLRIKLDKNIISLSNFIQCLTICIVFQEIINKFQNDNQNKSRNIFQFLWILLSILLQFCIQKGLLQNHFFQQNLNLNSLKEASVEILMQCKQKLYKYQDLSINQDSEFRLINFVILNSHISYCRKKECICQNQNLPHLKYESFLIKEITILFQQFLQQSQCQSSTFYIEFIQLLILQGKYFEALNWIQKLLNTFNKHQFNQRYFQYFKGQVSFQDKIILTVLYQQLLLYIQSVIQSSTNEYQNASIIQKAIRSLQQKVDSQQTIYVELNSILTMKIEYFIEIQHREKKDLISFDKRTHQILEKIESFKNKLESNFQQVPTHNNQSLLLYFQVEILNDLINSQTLSSMTSQINDEDIKNETNQIIDQLSSQFQVYTFSLMDEDNIEFLPNYSNKNQKRKQRYTHFNDMIPALILEIHKLYVRDFFQNGKNRFYLNISESLLQLDIGIISPIDMCMNVQFDLNMNRLIMIVFIRKQVKNPQDQILLLDSNFRINQMSKFLYQQFKNTYKNQINQFIGKQIFQFIPNLQQNHFIQDRNIGTFELSFIKMNSSPTKSPFQPIDRYFGNISVKVRNVKQRFIYYIVQITEIRSEKIGFSLNQISLPQIEFDEKEIVSIPIDNNQIQFDIQENFSNQIHQQISSRFETNRPFLFTNLGEAVEVADLQVEVNKDLYIPSSNQSEVSLQNKKIEVVDDIEKNYEDQGSQISSVAAVKRSLYYKQYLVINQLIFSKKFPNNIKKFNLFFFIFVIIGIINLILLISQVQQLQVYQELLSLLTIKYDIYEPIQSFLNTRYTIVALNQAVAIQLINQTEYNQLMVFPRSNLLRGYDDLKDNIYDVLSRQEFQSFLKDKYFESYWYESTNSSITKNITFRTGILALLEYQYDFKLAYTIRAIQTDSPYFFYSYENYISLINIFTDLSENILEQLILELKKQSSNLYLITTPMSIFSGFLTIFYLFYLISQRKIKNKFLNLAYQQNIEILMNEISRLRQIQEFLNWNQDQIYQYSLDVTSYDNQLKEQEKEYLKFINKKSNKIQRKRFSSIKIFNYIQILILILNIGLLQAIYQITLDSLNKYLDKSSNTAIFYESLSSTGVDILIAYSEREVLYRRIFIMFFKQSDIDDIIKLIEHSLNDIQNFTQKLTLLNQKDYLLDDQSLQLFDDVSQNSLCNYLPEEFSNYSTTLCPTVLLGVLNNGLYQTLNFMYNSIHSEIKINNFSFRNDSQIPIRELEGATFTAKVIKVLVQLLYNNIFNFTNRILISFTIIFFCAIILETLIGLIIIIKFSEFEKKQINNLRKIVYLLPKSTLLFDDGFQRQIKNLIQISEVI